MFQFTTYNNKCITNRGVVMPLVETPNHFTRTFQNDKYKLLNVYKLNWYISLQIMVYWLVLRGVQIVV